MFLDPPAAPAPVAPVPEYVYLDKYVCLMIGGRYQYVSIMVICDAGNII